MNRFITIGAMAVVGAMTAGCNAPTPGAQVQKDVAAAKDAAAGGGFTLGLLGSVIDAGPLQLVGDG